MIPAEEPTFRDVPIARRTTIGALGTLRSPRLALAALQPVRAIALFSVLMGAGLLATPSPAQQADGVDVQAEYNVKAAFLYNFGRYVEWPREAFAGPGDAFVIGILGDAPIGEPLDQIAAKKTIEGRRVVLRRFASLAEYRPPCHILFVSGSLSPEQQTDAVTGAQGLGVLTVGETLGFADRGGAINFSVEGGRVRFEINVEAARGAQLHMDAKLLSLGKRTPDRRPAADGKGRSPVVSQTASPP